MLNTRFFNFHDIVMIGFIVIIIHLIARPLFDAVGSKSAGTADAAG